HGVDGHGEYRVLVRELGFRIVRREFHLHVALVANLGADELVLEARNELAGAEHQVEAFCLAARELLAIDAADEIDRDLVVLFGSFALGAVRIAARLLGQLHHRFVNLGLRHVADQLLDLELGDIGQLEIRHQIHLHGEFEVGLAIDDLLDLAVEIDARRECRLEIVVLHGLLAGLVDRLFDDLAHHLLAESLLQVRGRGLAGAKTFQVHARLHLFDAAAKALVQIVRRNDDLVFAAEVLIDGLCDLHGAFLNPQNSFPSARVVRAKGLEPPRLSSLEPKSSASTNSATPARGPRHAPYYGCAPEGGPYSRGFWAGLGPWAKPGPRLNPCP